VFSYTGGVGFNSGLIRVADLVGNGGTVNLNGGTVVTNGFSKGAGTGSINANSGTVKAASNSTNLFANFAGTGGSNSVNLLNTIGSGGLKMDTNGFAVTISNVLSGTGGLSKVGDGSLTLSGANTYTGTTSVSAGSLNLTGSVAGPTSVTGGTLNLAGSSASLTIGAGGNLSGQGTANGPLTFTGSSQFNVIPTGTFLTANSVDASGGMVLINPLAALSATPQVILSAAGGITGAIGPNFVLQSRASLTYNAGSTQLLLAVSGSNNIKWKGNLSNQWNLQTQNWTNLGSPDVYFNADNVTFDDSASTFNVSIQPATVTPASVTFANSANDYTLTGGAIGGTASIVFNGSRSVIVANSDSYSGSTSDRREPASARATVFNDPPRARPSSFARRAR
jgi:fibronectin-binding autotransporter adhesin